MMANPVRLLRLGFSVILILGLLAPVAVTDTSTDIDINYNDNGDNFDPEEDHDDHDDDRDDGILRNPINVKASRKHGTCEDLRDDCVAWAADVDDYGLDCVTNSKYMHPHCPRTCKTCHNRTLRHVPIRQSFAPPRKTRYRGRRKVPIVVVAGTDLGVPQILQNANHQRHAAIQNQRMLERIEEARDYVENIVMVEPRYESVRTLCRNQYEDCALWATQHLGGTETQAEGGGECEDNAVFMRAQCAPVCFSCEDLHVDAKCPLVPNTKNAWYPGDLNLMFERLTTDPAFQQYTPTVLSRPDYVGDDTEETADYQLGPWVLVLEDFVSADEAERMIEAGDEIGYARSTDVGEVYADGTFEDKVSTSRTSMNAWCNEESCYEDPLVKDVIHRIETLTQIPPMNSESLQLLRYEEGQFYKVHHDYIGTEKDRAQGVRILTVFLYLSDVEQGGGTNFPSLDLTVEPKRGRVLLWPSVLDEDPHEYDDRTYHQALPVIEGLKYGANAWFHQRDVVTPTLMGC
jgi:prolyl 4-hydroxylase